MSSLEQPIKDMGDFRAGRFDLDASETQYFKVDASSPVTFDIYHSSPRPDHTPRSWVSLQPRNQSISWGGPVGFVNIKKKPYTFNILQSNDKSLYKQLYTFLVTGDTVYLNIQNLENFRTQYTIKIDGSTGPGGPSKNCF